ncbi:TetR/AcrR family transcriptional regulator [Adlercreutzia sp. ZJ242]|uniref:TetR/AcrR family transcriptional regulator n=1 Tax=Adlercreutzia sp. ZJ242 TaxID=2709409 RepID=UPI0013EC12C1|nr:TetR/AcrR family transcriptional regulator [Adlercreutzia sp. ZJ242]
MKLTEGMGKSEAAIIDACLNVMRFKPYDKVRVKDVLEESGVVRSTFYKYFDDMYSLLERVEIMLLGRLSLYKSSSKAAREAYAGMPFESMENWFEVCIELRGAVAPLMGPNGDPYFYRRLQNQMRRELNDMMDDDGVPADRKRPYYVELCTAAYIGILSYLITTGDDDLLLSAREMATMANSARAAWFMLDERSPDISEERLFGQPDRE